MTDRDDIWVDMTQFDTDVADGLWDGTTLDDEAPGWYGHMRSLVLRARGPAEADELADEHELVACMRRAALGEVVTRPVRLRRPPRPIGVRTLGRVVAMKAAATATVAAMVSVAAAATTGIVVTMAATVVVPAVNERVVPMIERHDAPEPVAPASPAPRRGSPGSRGCADDARPCPTRRLAPATIDLTAPSTPPPGSGRSGADDATTPSTPATQAPTADTHPAPPTGEPALSDAPPTPPDPATTEATTEPAPDSSTAAPTTTTTDGTPTSTAPAPATPEPVAAAPAPVAPLSADVTEPAASTDPATPEPTTPDQTPAEPTVPDPTAATPPPSDVPALAQVPVDAQPPVDGRSTTAVTPPRPGSAIGQPVPPPTRIDAGLRPTVRRAPLIGRASAHRSERTDRPERRD
jgi:hypothetical protein